MTSESTLTNCSDDADPLTTFGETITVTEEHAIREGEVDVTGQWTGQPGRVFCLTVICEFQNAHLNTSYSADVTSAYGEFGLKTGAVVGSGAFAASNTAIIGAGARATTIGQSQNMAAFVASRARHASVIESQTAFNIGQIGRGFAGRISRVVDGKVTVYTKSEIASQALGHGLRVGLFWQAIQREPASENEAGNGR